MIEKCLKCKKPFEQQPVDYRQPDNWDNHHNYGEYPDCCWRERLVFLRKNRKPAPVYIQRVEKRQDPLDDKTKAEIREFFVKEYYKPDSVLKRKADAYPLIRKEFGLGLSKEYIIFLLHTKTLQKLGYKISFFRNNRKKIIAE